MLRCMRKRVDNLMIEIKRLEKDVTTVMIVVRHSGRADGCARHVFGIFNSPQMQSLCSRHILPATTDAQRTWASLISSERTTCPWYCALPGNGFLSGTDASEAWDKFADKTPLGGGLLVASDLISGNLHSFLERQVVLVDMQGRIRGFGISLSIYLASSGKREIEACCVV